MKNIKKVLAIILSALTVMLCFAGCSQKSAEAEKITSDTMLIAYTQENKPFIYTDKNGELTGFDVEVFKKIFNDIKNEAKNYKFVQVEEGYRVGEDTAYTDEDGNEYIAYVMVGGIEKNKDTFNKEHSFTADIIDNRVITVTNGSKSAVTTYANLQGTRAGIVGDVAKTALDKHTTIKQGLKSIKEYKDAKSALADLKSGKLDEVIIDEFNFNVADDKDSFVVLDGELEEISYVYSLKKYDWYVESINKAIYELQSPEYKDADEFTPIVEKYFGYDASNFDFQPEKTK